MFLRAISSSPGGRITGDRGATAEGRDEIDANDRLVLPGGVDSHCTIDQAFSDRRRMRRRFRSAPSRRRAAGRRPSSPRRPAQGALAARGVEAITAARGQIDHRLRIHLIVSDPTAQVLGQELPALIRDGCTAFKIYMTYDDLKLNDRQVLEVLALARGRGPWSWSMPRQ